MSLNLRLADAKKSIDMTIVRRDATFVASTFNKEERTVELLWSTGARVPRVRWVGWDERVDYDEELSLDPKHVRLDRLNNGAPLLDSHRQWSLSSVMGVVERAWLVPGEGRALVRFSGRDEVAPFVRDVEAKVIRNVSVGYWVYRYDITRKEGEKELWRAVDWEPGEISLVPVPADPHAGVRGQQPGETRACQLVMPEQRIVAPSSDGGLDLHRRRLQLAGLR